MLKKILALLLVLCMLVVIVACGQTQKVFQGHYHKGDFQKIEQIEYITLQAMCEGEKNIYTVIEI